MAEPNAQETPSDDGPWLVTPDTLPDDPIAGAMARLAARDARRAAEPDPAPPPTPLVTVLRAALLIGLAILACAYPGPPSALVFLATTALVGLHAQRGAPWGAMGVVGVLGVIGTLALLALLPTLDRIEEQGRRRVCANHLRQLGQALILYRDQSGHGVWYPTADGAGFLVALHASGVLGTDDYLLTCPSTTDLARPTALQAGRIPPTAVSYAGRRNAVQDRYPGLYRPEEGDTVIASDDDEGGGKRFNHGDVVQLLFLDGHVERLPADDPQVARGPGVASLLDPLAN